MSEDGGMHIPPVYRDVRGDIESDYIYTPGIAGQRFFSELKEKGILKGTRCPRCRALHLPPRLFCETCFVELEEWRVIPREGRVESFTLCRIGLHGEKLLQPEVWGIVRFPGVRGGLVHRILVEPERLRIGLRVRVLLKERKDRQGAITDILGFVPA